MAEYNNGRERPRNAGPTPPSKPTPPTPLNQQRTKNPNAYESSADIVARRNAENARKAEEAARRNPIARPGGPDRFQYFENKPLPQMPPLPREGMTGLEPQAKNTLRTPFHLYPSFGGEESPLIPDRFLGEVVAGASGSGKAFTPEEEMMIAEQIMQALQGKRFGNQDEYRMDGTYSPFRIKGGPATIYENSGYEDENGRPIATGRRGMSGQPIMPYLPQFHADLGTIPGVGSYLIP
jgi:hypothetical protein